MNNYPDNFKGIEGEEEETFIFEISGEVMIEHVSEEDAEEELMGMTIREALTRGLYLD